MNEQEKHIRKGRADFKDKEFDIPFPHSVHINDSGIYEIPKNLSDPKTLSEKALLIVVDILLHMLYTKKKPEKKDVVHPRKHTKDNYI